MADGNEASSNKSRLPPPPPRSRKVAVIGGGIAGITAAIKLYRQDYEVTLFEKGGRLGGNLSSNSPDDSFKENDAKGKGANSLRDVYPHIFAEWYTEFWYLLEQDLGLKRSDLFKRSENIQMAVLPKQDEDERERFSDVKFETIYTPTNIDKLVNNLQGEALSGRDMLLFGYSYLDLISAPTEAKRSKTLSELDVTGYLHSRPYMNDAVAGFHDDTLKVIWSVPSEQTSAIAYQKLLRHTLTFPKGTPFAWLLNGPLHERLMGPIEEKLRLALGGGLKLNTEVTSLDLAPNNGCATVRSKPSDVAEAECEEFEPEEFDYVVMATPADAAAKLAIRSEPLSKDSTQKLADRHPQLARLREAQYGRIPVVYLYLKQTFWDAHRRDHPDDLEFIPTELTGFKRRGTPSNKDKSRGSTSGNYDISMLNLAAVWDKEALEKHLNQRGDEPIFVLAASHADAIEAPAPGTSAWDEGKLQGFAMIKKLEEYFPFIKAGKEWNDPDSVVDWSMTHVVHNSDHLLFLNTVASNQWRPNASLEYYKRSGRDPNDSALNIFFAGDYCMTDVDMATVEAATQSGVQAARALMYRHGDDHEAVPFQSHKLYTTDALVLAKLASTPAAFAASLMAIYEEAALDPRRAITLPGSATVLAVSYWSDWLRSAEHLIRLQVPGHRRDKHKEWDWRDVHPHDERLGILQMAANAALAMAVEGPRVGPKLKESVVEAIYQGWHQSIGRIYFPDLRSSLLRNDDEPADKQDDKDKKARDGKETTDSAGAKAVDPYEERKVAERKRKLAAVRRTRAEELADRAPGAKSTPPSTWRDLLSNLDGGAVAELAGKTMFGAAAAGVGLLQRLKDDDSKSTPFADHLKAAIRESVEASERKGAGYRYYSPPRPLPDTSPELEPPAQGSGTQA